MYTVNATHAPITTHFQSKRRQQRTRARVGVLSESLWSVGDRAWW